MSKLSVPLAVGIATATLLIGTAFGYYISPEYQGTMYENQDMGLGTADRWLDLRYINTMIAHHRGAILVGKQLEKSERPELQDLSKAIQTGEPKLIAELYQWKKEWYNDTRQVKDPKVPNLGEYNKTFDLRALNTLIAHHTAGIEMTKEVRLKTSRTEIIDNADAVENFLKGGIESLKALRKNWYGI
ncbi:MAG: DUF305 domain-containing protein [Patescibacteria group bacterium]